MHPLKPISLQTKLIKTSLMSSVVAGLLAILLLLGISIYQSMVLQDGIMHEVSDILLETDLSRQNYKNIDELSDQFEIQYQLNWKQKLLTQSEQFDDHFKFRALRNQDEEQWGFVWFEDEIFRVYEVQKDDQLVKLYQPIQIRFAKVFESILTFLGVIVLLWLIQWFILHFAVKKQFRMLKALSTVIAQKSAQDLSKIQPQQPELKELQPIVKQLNAMLSRLETSLIAEQRFTADASHELRSPLSAIQMRLQLLKRKYSDQAFSKDLNQIEIDVRRSSNILENLLLLARLDPTQSHALPTKTFDLNEMIHEVEKSLEPFARDKDISLSLDTKSVHVQANQELIFSCIRNLLDNAIRYASPSSEILIKLFEVEKVAYLHIQNEGEFVAEDVVKRMGERFYRELGTKTQGSGLGISICKKIVDLHQGQISFENQFENQKQGGLMVKLSIPTSFQMNKRF